MRFRLYYAFSPRTPRCHFQSPWPRSRTYKRLLSQGPIYSFNITQSLISSHYSPTLVANADLRTIQSIFGDEKQAKQIFSAAKRVSKKRGSNETSDGSPIKRKRLDSSNEPITLSEAEESLALPTVIATEVELLNTMLYTNRAPLVLAFAVTLLKYTMPEQPLSSRLSLAQAVVSVNSRSKALSLGIEKGKSAEDDGWGEGQPKVRVMGRDISVMKQWGYKCKYSGHQGDKEKPKIEQNPPKAEEPEATDASNQSSVTILDEPDDAPALWGLDLEALRSSNGSKNPASRNTSNPGLPIYTAHSARAYLLKSFASAPSLSGSDSVSKKKKSAKAVTEEKEQNLAFLLHSLDLLYSSWSQILGHEELDRRSWAWYISVRPEVQDGVAGWGAKGELKLSNILNLRRKP